MEADRHLFLCLLQLSLGLLVADFGAMVNNPHLSDVQFQIDSGEVLYAHKFVLYARCPLLIQHVSIQSVGGLPLPPYSLFFSESKFPPNPTCICIIVKSADHCLSGWLPPFLSLFLLLSFSLSQNM